MHWRRKYNFNVSNLGIDLINMNQWVKNKSSLTKSGKYFSQRSYHSCK